MLAGRATAALGLAVLAVLLACAPAPGAPALRAGRRQGRHHAADRLLPRRLDPRRPRRRRASTRGCTRGRSCSSATGARSRWSRSTCSWSPAGWSSTSASALRRRGFSEQNILISASHTHSGPGGYANFPTLNTAAPSLQTATDPSSFFELLQPRARRPAALPLPHRADHRRRSRAPTTTSARPRPAGARARIVGPDAQPQHRGAPGQPRHRQGARRGQRGRRPGRLRAHDRPGRRTCCASTSSSARAARRRVRVPIGGWSTFADHGTVTKSSFQFYNADHHALGDARLRGSACAARARCPRGQEVSTSTATPTRATCRPGSTATARRRRTTSGRVEAAAMLRAWRAAGRRLSRTPALDLRWTRVCFCGQAVEGGPRSPTSPRSGCRSSPAPRRSAGRSSTSPASTSRTRRAPATAATRTGTRLGARGRRRRAQRRAAARGAGRPAADRLASPARGPRRSARGSATAVGARGRRARGIERVVRLRPGQRVRPLLHDARGVRPPALRGRQHALRARCRRC